MLRKAFAIAALSMFASLPRPDAQQPGPIALPPQVQSETGAPAAPAPPPPVPGQVAQPTAPLPPAAPQPGTPFPPGLGGTTSPSPAPTVQPSGNLVGRWQGQSYQGGMYINTTLEFDQNGNLNQLDVFPNGLSVQIWGTYQVQPISATQISVSLVPAGWNPRELCGLTGRCVPVHYAPQRVLMIFEDANTVQEPVINATFRRMP